MKKILGIVFLMLFFGVRHQNCFYKNSKAQIPIEGYLGTSKFFNN